MRSFKCQKSSPKTPSISVPHHHAMTFQTHALTQILKDANGLKQLLRHLPSPTHCNHNTEAILPLRLPSPKDILSRFGDSLLPPEVLKHCEVVLSKSEVAIRRTYEASCRELYSAAPPNQDQIRKFQHVYESLYDKVCITPVCNIVIAAKQKINRASPETPKDSLLKTRTRFRQVSDANDALVSCSSILSGMRPAVGRLL